MADLLTDEEITSLRSLMAGLVMAGLTDPTALATAGKLVAREKLAGQKAVNLANLATQQAAVEAARQKTIADNAALDQQVAALNLSVGQ